MNYAFDDDGGIYVTTGVGGGGDVFTPEGLDFPLGSDDDLSGSVTGDTEVTGDDHKQVTTFDGKDDQGNEVHERKVVETSDEDTPGFASTPGTNSNVGDPGDEDSDSEQDDSDVTDPQSDGTNDGIERHGDD